jgi:hypothetical protein
MLLINKITFNQLSIYRKDVIKCLKNNINNAYINEILIFLDVVDENLPKHNKIKYVTKPKYSDLEIIEYSKKVSNRQNIIFTKSLHSFGQELKNFNVGDYIENSNFIFFKRNYDIKSKLTNDTVNNKVVRNKPIRFNKPTILESKEINISNKLDVVTVSVNYNDYLKKSLENNTKIFDNITVVTSEVDIECQEICKTYDVNCIVCDDILKDGIINKSIGLNKGINSLNNPDWILILDADIIVGNKIETQNLDYKNLYTNSRWIIEDMSLYNEYKSGNKQLSDFKFEKDKGIGFFQLFNWRSKKSYPDSNWGRYSESTWSDITFKKGFKKVDSLNLEIIHLGKPYQKWIAKSEDSSILKKSKRDSSIKPKLAVLTTFFNPKNYINLRYNYLKFSEKIKEKADLFPIELSFNGEFFIEDENVIRIEGSQDNILWQKERLLNIALDNLPKEYTNVAWIDCDIIFENENWVDEVNEKLNEYKVLHLFENAKRLDENGKIDRISKSIIRDIKDSNTIPVNLNKGITGFGWAIRREDIDKIKFLDTQIIGGGDALMFFSFVGLNNTVFHKKMNKEWLDFYNKWHDKSFSNICLSINNISGDIIHLYHGKMVNRNYNSRYDILSKDKFNPDLDLVVDNNNLWRFKGDIGRNLEKYFESRDEDDNIIDINEYFDNIYILNLDRRIDRYENIKSKLNILNIKFERFSAIDGNNIKDETLMIPFFTNLINQLNFIIIIFKVNINS